MALAAAAHVPEFATSVCFYGIPPQEFAKPAKVAIPFQGHFSNQDDWCTPEAVNDLEAILATVEAGAEIYRYDAAHGFFNETSETAYNPVSANLAWERMLKYLSTNL